jgi:hypothetical protein
MPTNTLLAGILHGAATDLPLRSRPPSAGRAPRVSLEIPKSRLFTEDEQKTWFYMPDPHHPTIPLFVGVKLNEINPFNTGSTVMVKRIRYRRRWEIGIVLTVKVLSS